MGKRRYVEGMPISQFIDIFFETKHECRKLKHQGLKSFDNPYLIGISNDIAFKNPDCVARNEIIVVIDDYGNMGSYLNPDHIKRLTELEICKYQLKQIEKITLHNLNSIQSVYQKYNELNQRIKVLEGLYGKGYDLLFYTERMRVLRNIKRYAKLEAEKTLEIVLLPQTTQVDETNENFAQELTTYEVESVIEEGNKTYQVTSKMNRQKKLSNYKNRYEGEIIC